MVRSRKEKLTCFQEAFAAESLAKSMASGAPSCTVGAVKIFLLPMKSAELSWESIVFKVFIELPNIPLSARPNPPMAVAYRASIKSILTNPIHFLFITSTPFAPLFFQKTMKRLKGTNDSHSY